MPIVYLLIGRRKDASTRKRKHDGEAGETHDDHTRTVHVTARTRVDTPVREPVVQPRGGSASRVTRCVTFRPSPTVHEYTDPPDPPRAELENTVRCLIESTKFGPVLDARNLSVDAVFGKMDSQTLASFATALVRWRDAVLAQ